MCWLDTRNYLLNFNTHCVRSWMFFNKQQQTKKWHNFFDIVSNGASFLRHFCLWVRFQMDISVHLFALLKIADFWKFWFNIEILLLGKCFYHRNLVIYIIEMTNSWNASLFYQVSGAKFIFLRLARHQHIKKIQIFIEYTYQQRFFLNFVSRCQILVIFSAKIERFTALASIYKLLSTFCGIKNIKTRWNENILIILLIYFDEKFRYTLKIKHFFTSKYNF